MRAPAFLALPLLLASPLVAQDAAPAEVDPATDPRTRVLLLGDSISHGYHQTVVAELGDDFHVVRPMNANGKGYENCEGTTKGVKELDRWLALDGGHWDVIHFNFGLHDLKHVLPGTLKNSNDPTHPNQAPIDVYERQLREITERLVATGAEVIFATTTPVPEGGVRPFRDPWDASEYNFVAQRIMHRLEVHVTPLYAYAGSRLDELQQPVNVHFTKEGSRRLGEVVARVIRSRSAGIAPAQKALQSGETWQHNRKVFVNAVVELEKLDQRDRVGTLMSHPTAQFVDEWADEPLVWPIAEQLKPAQATDSEVNRSRGNPAVERVRTLQRDGYKIEHLLIESRAGMHIPAHLYLPDPNQFSPPYAGVLVACGHAYEAKAHAPYQIAGATFARHGMAALVFDPLDQGERIQAPKDDASRQQHWGTTSHNITGAQARLVGWSQAGLHAYDAMRCLDALEADPRIDADRLGMCGQSGGGTQTAQLSAIDQRILASAPACYITSLPALARTIGPQDEEQNLFGQVPAGIDHLSYIVARAPKPTLICAAEDDFFAFEGTSWTFERAKQVYSDLNAGDNIELAVSPGGHNWGRELVSATVVFMAKHLDKREITVDWSDEVPMSANEAQVTPHGHVVWMPGERTIYSLIEERGAWLLRGGHSHGERPFAGSVAPEVDLVEGGERSAESIRIQVRRAFGWWPWTVIRPARSLRVATQLSERRRNRAASLFSGGSIALHAADLVDENEEQDPTSAWLVIGAGVSNAKPPVDALGSVHYLDVVCSGELTPTDRAWYGSFGPAGTDGAYGVLLGRPLLVLQVEQILAYAKNLQGRPRLAAAGLPALAAAHAYAIAPERFAEEHSIELPFQSWTNLFGYDVERDALAFIVPDALRHYDLDQLLPE